MTETTKWESEWQWWAGTNEGWFTVGPCATRDSIINEMSNDGCGEFLDNEMDPPVWKNSFHIVEARQDQLRLADWIETEFILERADEALADSDRVSCEYDDGPWFDATKEQEKDLEERLKRACDEWQEAHGLVFVSTTFSHSRNHEHIVTSVTRDTDE